MAEPGRREQVGDPLAFNPRESLPDRSLPLSGIRGNSSSNNALFAEQEDIISGMSGLRNVISKQVQQGQEDAITKGKVDFMSGVTEQQMRATGNYHERLGYESLSAVNKANTWYNNEVLALDGEVADMDPKAYKEYLGKKNAELFKSLPDDPAVREIYVAAFQDQAPRLASAQIQKYSDRNYDRKVNEFDTYLNESNSSDTPRRSGPSNLAISDSVIDTPIASAARDRDIGIKTMLGEAGGESDVGLAGVAHVLKNRSLDSRWGGSISDVALAPKQFSTWNSGPGGNRPQRYKPGTPAYERAGRVYDAVMAGKTVDPTGGATHYYSPAGMKTLVAGGSQNNLIPRWLEKEAKASGGTIKIGGHIFVGKTNHKGGAGTNTQKVIGPNLDDAPNVIDADTGETVAPDSPSSTSAVSPPMHQVGEVGIDALPAAAKARLEAGETTLEEEQAALGIAPVEAEKRITAPEQAAADQGIPTENTTPRASTQTQAFIREQAAQLKPGDGAKRVAKTLAFQLSQGNTKLLDEIGGVAFLSEIDGGPEEMKIVQTAIDRMDADKEKEFNVENVKAKQDLLDAVEADPSLDFDTQVLPVIKQMVDANLLTDAGANALANETANKMRGRAKDTMMGNPEMRMEVMREMREFQELDPETMTDEEYEMQTKLFSEDLIAVGEKYGAPISDINQFVGQAFSLAGSKRTSAEAEAKTVQKKALENNALMDQVKERIATGQGVTGITGSIKITDTDGAVKTITPEDFYVKQVQQDAVKEFRNAHPDGKAEEIGPAIDNIIFPKLIRAGVVDRELASQMKAGVSGNIRDKDGKVTEAAKATFDLAMRIDRMPQGGEYLSAMFAGDMQTKALLDQAITMYDGRIDIETALIRAAEERDKVEKDPLYKMKLDNAYAGAIGTKTSEMVTEMTKNQSWFGSPVFDQQDKKYVLKNSQAVENALQTKANALQMQNPSLSAEAALKTAKDEVMNNSVAIGDGVHVAARPEERLDRLMGVEDFGRDKPQQILDEWMETHAEEKLGLLYSNRRSGAWDTFKQAIGIGGDMGTALYRQSAPRYHVTHIWKDGAGKSRMRIGIYEDGTDPSKGFATTIETPSVEEMGKAWKDKQNEPTMMGDAMTRTREFFGRGAGAKFLFEPIVKPLF